MWVWVVSAEGGGGSWGGERVEGARARVPTRNMVAWRPRQAMGCRCSGVVVVVVLQRRLAAVACAAGHVPVPPHGFHPHRRDDAPKAPEPLHQHHIRAGPPRTQGGGQAGRAATHHQHVAAGEHGHALRREQDAVRAAARTGTRR